MNTNIFSIARLSVVISVLMAGMAKPAAAEILYTDPNAYFSLTGSSPWALTGDYDGLLTPTHFEFQNTNSKEAAMVTVFSLQGTTGDIGVDANRIMYDSESAGWYDIHTPYAWGMSLPTMAAIESFYVKAGVLTDPDRFIPANAALATHVTLLAIDSLGNEWTMHQSISDDMFFGLILEEGYVTDVYWHFSDGTGDVLLSFKPDRNTPYSWDFYGSWQYVEFGFGDGTLGGENVTPEPATMLMFGIGLAGLPLVRRLRKK